MVVYSLLLAPNTGRATMCGQDARSSSNSGVCAGTAETLALMAKRARRRA
jgi:hypothetical protein